MQDQPGADSPVSYTHLDVYKRQAVKVLNAEAELGLSMSLPSSFAIPLRRFSVVLWNPFAFAVCIAEPVLSACVSLLSEPTSFR